jgi:hypothetical protein
MAFKMTPKSPTLMATGKFGSPAKNMNKGYGPAKTSSPAKQRSGNSMTAAEKKAMNDRSVFGPDGKNVAKPPKSKTITPKKGNKTVKGEKYGKSPAKKNGMKYDIKEASNQNLTAKARKHFAENAQHDSKKSSPAKQKEQDPTQIPGNQVRAHSKGGSIRAPKVSYDMAYEKRDKKKYNMSKADYIKEAKRQTKSKLDTNDWGANQRKKTKATTTLKADGVKNTKTAMPTAKPIKAKAIKVASKTTAKPDRSQRLKAKSDKTAAKGKKAVDEGKTKKADRLLKRAARQENRSIKKEKRQAGRATKKAAKA